MASKPPSLSPIPSPGVIQVKTKMAESLTPTAPRNGQPVPGRNSDRIDAIDRLSASTRAPRGSRTSRAVSDGALATDVLSQSTRAPRRTLRKHRITGVDDGLAHGGKGADILSQSTRVPRARRTSRAAAKAPWNSNATDRLSQSTRVPRGGSGIIETPGHRERCLELREDNRCEIEQRSGSRAPEVDSLSQSVRAPRSKGIIKKMSGILKGK